MAPLNRSYSLPVSLSNPVSRLKALSGAAGRDEVSEKNRRDHVKSPLSTPPLAAVIERTASPSTFQRPSPESSFSDLAPSEEGSRDSPSKQSPVIVPHKRWSLSNRIKKTLSIDLSPKNSKDGLGLEGIESAPLEEERGRRRFRKSKSVKIKEKGKEKEKEKERVLTVPAPNQTYPPVTTPTPANSSLPLDNQASNLILGAIDRGRPGQISPSSSATDLNKRSSGAFAALGLKAASIGLATPSRVPEDQGTDTAPTSTTSTPKASFLQPSKPVGGGSSRGPRAPSPFFRARKSREQARERDKSPEVKALKKDNYSAESEVEPETEAESVSGGGPKKYRPQASAYEDDSASDSASQSDSESHSGDSDEDYADIIDEDGEVIFDEETEKNTEANAVFFEGDAAGLGGRSATGEDGEKEEVDDPEVPSMSPREDDQLDFYGEEVEQDPLGEGPNVVVPPQSLFQTASLHQPKRRKSLRSGIELVTSRPSFARDRCTITLTHGDPDGALELSGKRLRRYVVLSDLSEESRYAVEWAIGTVARDGDELFMISVKEDESKVDPKAWSNSDRAQKLRVQKERQTTALLLVKQVTGLLQRTRLNITVTCQFVHAKNARHMLLDLIDFLEPTMVIVGSRGLGKLQGILLGSTSHYLVQKSSVPVMVARRRLQRPLRKTNPANLRHSPRVSLASASIEKTASSKQEDEVMDVAESEKEEGKSGTVAASASAAGGPNPPA
ncbi:hypothetical protein I302_106987 [Kwoniella bestiolae CBS 10118]|uniref:UspA domain-containing protein n=1 Tax=Kwoniella bestiolae CBS 10118 TaxID=1296100 RepID=A0A1B9FZU9_9TREE|nr:hypothetical protein I302_05749 [Kwoniella bestiolae CBS 10118]OCF24290.1 hypothetical protein I302_05749 [Kwoniella bestiolae CBS 10118]